jgi:hypothetical protein
MNAPAEVNGHGVYRMPRVVTNSQKVERELERQRSAEIEALNKSWDARIEAQDQASRFRRRPKQLQRQLEIIQPQGSN